RQTKGAGTDRPNLRTRETCPLLYFNGTGFTGFLRMNRIFLCSNACHRMVQAQDNKTGTLKDCTAAIFQGPQIKNPVNPENPVNPVLLADCDARADKTGTCFALVVSGIRRIYPGTTKLQHHPFSMGSLPDHYPSITT
ncbi:MAG: hypothetical protein LGR52_10705, partial [Candidatus Thiosymbion ectosymbiont of Robbea hypermnestra]|nr:hypothetical protein [Candidatus Thiosymbion ectosymbiont of Robbea hypermnestra]